MDLSSSSLRDTFIGVGSRATIKFLFFNSISLYSLFVRLLLIDNTFGCKLLIYYWLSTKLFINGISMAPGTLIICCEAS